MGHCRWCKCDCEKKVDAVLRTMPLLRRRRGHRLAARVDARCVGACVLDMAVLDVALTKYFESQCDPDRRRNRYVSVWRMEDFSPCCWSENATVLIVAQLTCTTILVRTHAYFTHTTFFDQNKKEETHAHTARHYFMMAKTAHIDIFSRSHSSLHLCQADTGRASPLDRLCVSKPRRDGSRLRSPPWFSHVTSIAMSKLSSQQ